MYQHGVKNTLKGGAVVFGASAIFLLAAPEVFLDLLGFESNSELIWSMQMKDQAMQLGIDAESAHWLLHRHGTKVCDIFQQIKIDSNAAHRIVSSLPLIYADLLYCAASEMVCHLDDLLRRRLPMLILANLTGDDLHRLAQRVASVFQWDSARIEQEKTRCSR